MYYIWWVYLFFNTWKSPRFGFKFATPLSASINQTTIATTATNTYKSLLADESNNEIILERKGCFLFLVFFNSSLSFFLSLCLGEQSNCKAYHVVDDHTGAHLVANPRVLFQAVDNDWNVLLPVHPDGRDSAAVDPGHRHQVVITADKFFRLDVVSWLASL